MSRLQKIFKFSLVSSSWVVIHPQPKGIIQFIGGAFFGSLPTVSYRQFLYQLYQEGYTLIVFPFRFSFSHLPVARQIFQEQANVREKITERARMLGYKSDIYQNPANYFWLGHSLGSKFIILLELFSERQNKEIASIFNQSCLLIAPVISNTDRAVPLPFLATIIDGLGLGVMPKREEMQAAIAKSSAFNLTAIISFSEDTIAGSIKDSNPVTRDNSDVLWFIQQWQQKPFPLLHQELNGEHLDPIGLSVGDCLASFASNGRSRQLEAVTKELLEKLEQRRRVY